MSRVRLVLAGAGVPNSASLMSFSPDDNLDHPQASGSIAQSGSLARTLGRGLGSTTGFASLGVSAVCRKSVSSASLGLRLALLFSEGRDDDAATLIVQIDLVLLVDRLLFGRGWVRASDIEAAVLHEVVIRIAATALAPSRELAFAIRQRRSFGVFRSRRFFDALGAIFIIRRRGSPPLRTGRRRHQRETGE